MLTPLTLLAIEPEVDECGYHAAVIELGEDVVLHVTNSYPRIEDAVGAAQDWIEKNS
jgi:hypothetical protein